jgi:hypothetical protein
MRDLLAIPAVWGLCGGLLSGMHGLVTAYSRKAGTPEARQTAWLRLGFGIVAGPIAAQPAGPDPGAGDGGGGGRPGLGRGEGSARPLRNGDADDPRGTAARGAEAMNAGHAIVIVAGLVWIGSACLLAEVARLLGPKFNTTRTVH